VAASAVETSRSLEHVTGVVASTVETLPPTPSLKGRGKESGTLSFPVLILPSLVGRGADEERGGGAGIHLAVPRVETRGQLGCGSGGGGFG
jgi:hypothetical protein